MKANESPISSYLEDRERAHAAALPRRFCVEWTSPANIAFVKYWGKKRVQLPRNPSVAMGLLQSRSMFRVSGMLQETNRPSLEFMFDGKKNPAFRERLQETLKNIGTYLPFAERYALEVFSGNTFPHSAGIASSASSMSAFVLCLLSLENHLLERRKDACFYRKASWLARLGSGSACRSVYPGFSLWGRTREGSGSDEYAVPLGEQVHPVFRGLRDHILVIGSGKKGLSSSRGHALMKHHPFAASRYRNAFLNTGRLLDALRSGDVEEFIRITESEALMLHALIMTSGGNDLLMRPATLEVIEKVWSFRRETGLPVCFTLDAGPNPHILFPASAEERALEFIGTMLREHCEEGLIIGDREGEGPVQVRESYD